MNNETYNVLALTGKIKGGKYKGYVVEIYNATPTGKFYTMCLWLFLKGRL